MKKSSCTIGNPIIQEQQYCNSDNEYHCADKAASYLLDYYDCYDYSKQCYNIIYE